MTRTCALACSIAVLVCLLACAADQSANAGSALGLASSSSTMESTAETTSNPTHSVEGPAGSSMDDLLRWGIMHSDPEQLKAMASNQERAQDADSIALQQARVAELLQAFREQPTEADLMREALAILRDHNSTVDQLHRALEALNLLVEPIDNANNLSSMNGTAAVVDMLAREHDPNLQAAAAGVIGVAASNNVVFQKQLLDAHPDAMALLVGLVTAANTTTASKALYAVACLVRNLPTHRAAFYEARGVAALQHALQARGDWLRLKPRALNLVSDLLGQEHERQLDGLEGFEGLVGAILGVLSDKHNVVQEETLLALKAVARTPLGLQVLAAFNGEVALRHFRLGIVTDPEALETLVPLCDELLDQLSSDVMKDEL